MSITRPASVPTWATGGSRRVEPDSGEKASGFVEAMRSAARKVNWILGLVADWSGYFAETFPGTEDLTVPLALGESTSGSGWALQMRKLTAGDPEIWIGSTSSGTVVFPLNGLLRQGMVLTGFKAAIIPGAARVGGNRMFVRLFMVDHRFNDLSFEPRVPGSLGFSADDATANKQYVEVTGLMHEVDLVNEYFIRIEAGSDASSNNDQILALRISHGSA